MFDSKVLESSAEQFFVYYLQYSSYHLMHHAGLFIDVDQNAHLLHVLCGDAKQRTISNEWVLGFHASNFSNVVSIFF